MAREQYQVTISKPTAAVYHFIADGSNNPKWRHSVLTAALESGEAGERGAEYSQAVRGPGGRSVAGHYRITRADRYRELKFTVTAGLIRPEGTFLLEEIDSGTRVTFILELELVGLAQQMSGTITKQLKNEVESLRVLARVLERAEVTANV